MGLSLPLSIPLSTQAPQYLFQGWAETRGMSDVILRGGKTYEQEKVPEGIYNLKQGIPFTGKGRAEEPAVTAR